MKSKNTGKVPKNKYSAPGLKKYKVSDLTKEWEMEVVGKEVSCPSSCIVDR
jgi:hypothetical protein